MGNRNHDISAVGEYFHCYNRGTDKRTIFADQQDYVYFLKSLRNYNSERPLGKLRLYENKEVKQPLVSIVTYCLLPNHFHLLLRNEVEDGISQYLKRVSGGYTMYFNKKNDRTGSLFQGVFKSRSIHSDQDLRQLTAYVYMNNEVHNLKDKTLFRSSLNTNLDVVRGFTSNLESDMKNMAEIVAIIKESRLGIDM